MQVNSEKEIALIVAQSIEGIIRDEGYIKHSVREKKFDTKGGNYFGDLLEVDIKGQTINGEKETNLFVKKCKTADYLEGLISLSDLYITETFIYNELSEVFTKLQNDANIPVEQRYKMVKSYPSAHANVIVLENLSRKGYKTMDRMNIITLDMAELSVQQVAKFHGLSFVIERKMPKYFTKILATVIFKWNWDEHWITYATNIINIGIDNIDADSKKKVIEFMPTFFDKFHKYVGLSDSNQILCLRHGDLKLTNMLYKEVDDAVAEVTLIDYQLSQYGNPAIDFLLLIYSCTDQAFRKQHLSYLMDLYHDSLRHFLQYFHMDVDEIYPKNQFQNDFKDRFDCAFMVAIFMYPLYYIPENSLDVGDDITKHKYKLDNKFQKRFKEVLEEWDEWDKHIKLENNTH